jgi:polyisoprenoid-binding protein YceI
MSEARNRRARTCGWLCAAAMLAPIANGQASLADPAKSSLRFTAQQAGVDLHGNFRSFSAQVNVDPSRLDQSSVQVDIDLASVTTGTRDADALLQSADFFDTARFPKARFTSNRITSVGAGSYRATGQLDLKGHSAPVELSFSAHADGGATRFEGSVPMSRLAFGVGLGEWSDTSTLDDEVRLDFSVRVAP